MRRWAFFLGGLLVWAADFFILYGISSVFLTTMLARILVGAVTLAAIAVDLWLLFRLRARLRASNDRVNRWMDAIALVGIGLSLVAVCFEGLPALLV